MYVDGRWYDAAFTGERRPGAAGTAVAILDEHVLRPLVGDDTGRIEIASALLAAGRAAGRVRRRTGAPCSRCGRQPSSELIEVADRGEVMPPKTTYFDPKPFAGIFLR